METQWALFMKHEQNKFLYKLNVKLLHEWMHE